MRVENTIFDTNWLDSTDGELIEKVLQAGISHRKAEFEYILKEFRVNFRSESYCFAIVSRMLK